MYTGTLNLFDEVLAIFGSEKSYVILDAKHTFNFDDEYVYVDGKVQIEG